MDCQNLTTHIGQIAAHQMSDKIAIAASWYGQSPIPGLHDEACVDQVCKTNDDLSVFNDCLIGLLEVGFADESGLC